MAELMDTDDVRGDELLAFARSQALRDMGWWWVTVGMSAGLIGFAEVGLPGVASWLLWMVAGATVSDTLAAAPGVLGSWREWRRLARCPQCRAAAAELDDALDEARSSHGWCPVRHGRVWS